MRTYEVLVIVGGWLIGLPVTILGAVILTVLIEDWKEPADGQRQDSR